MNRRLKGQLCSGHGGPTCLAGVLLALLLSMLSITSASAGTVDCTPTSGFNRCKRLTYSGTDQSFTVPSGVTSVDLRVWGAAGGGSAAGWGAPTGGGGGGGFARGTLAVTGGQILGVVVGQGGPATSTSATYGNGGGGGGATFATGYGGAGGGASAVFFSTTVSIPNLRIAAGGGGGGSPGAAVNGVGTGGGGGTSGGQDASPQISGRGGTQVSGGAAATGTSGCSIAPTAGSLGVGGTGGTANGGNNEGGGGGGGGYYGGGGGLCQSSSLENGGGGGGSSYISHASLSSGFTEAGDNFLATASACTGNSNAGGDTDPLYGTGIGQGSCFGNGGNGEVVIQYNVPSVAITMISHGVTGSYTFTGTNGWASQSITTITAGVGVQGARQDLATPSVSTTITLSIPANHSMANASCSGMGSGAMTPNYTTGALVFNAAATAAANTISCTVNLYKTPTFALRKISLGGVGNFNISSSSNLASTPGTLSTTSEGVAAPASPSAINVSVIGSAVSVTEAVPSNYALTGFSCTDANSTVTGNAGTFGTFSGSVVSIPAANVRAGSVFSCIITNTRSRIRFQKVTLGGIGTFSFQSTSNLQGTPGSMTTTSAGVAAPASPLPVNVNNIGTQVSVTEAAVAGYSLTAVSCSDANAAVTGTVGTFGSFSGNVVTIGSAFVKAGSDISCTLTNAKTPTFRLQVTSEAGSGGPITFAQTNLASTPPSIVPSAQNTLDPPSTVAINVVATGTAITVSQVVEYRYDLTAVSCTDANSAVTGNVGSFGSLAGPLGFQTLTIVAARVVAGAEFNCILTVKRIPRLQFVVVTAGGVAATGVTLPTNQPSQVITTTSPNVGVAGTPSYFLALNVDQTVTVTPALGYTLTSVSCSDIDANGPWGSGSISVNQGAATFTFAATQIVYGANYSCVITTSKTPLFKLQLQTSGGVGGPFTFTQSNLSSAPPSITTTTADTATPSSPSAITVLTIGAALTVSGTAPPGYDFYAATCSDANSSVTGNGGIFGTLSSGTLTVNAGNVVAGADVTCFLTSRKLPSITLSVVSNGMIGSFYFSGGNGFGSETIATMSAGVIVTGTTHILAAPDTATTITQTLNSSFIMLSATCAGLSSGSPVVDISAGTVILPASALSVGASVTCLISNEVATPALSLANAASPTVVASAGSIVTYTLTVSNTGNVPLASISVSNSGGSVVCVTSGNATISSLSPSGSEICNVNYTATQGDFDGNGDDDGDIDNLASTSATYASNPVSASTAASVALTLNPQLTIIKAADTGGPVAADEVITYSYTVTNTGNVTVANVSISDLHDGFGVTPVPGSEVLFSDVAPLGDSSDSTVDGTWATLAPGDSVRFSSSYSVVQADIDNQ